MSTPLTVLCGWLLTWALHSTVLLALAWCLDRQLSRTAAPLRWLGLREWSWRLALWLPLASATLAGWRGQAFQGEARLTSPSRVVTAMEEAPASAPIDLVVPGQLRRVGPPASAASEALPLSVNRPSGGSTMHASVAGIAPGWLRFWLLLWAVPAVLGLVRLWLQWHRTRRHVAHLPRVTEAHWLQLAATVAPQLPALLRVDAGAQSPLAGPGPQVVLPSWVLTLDCPQQRRAMLAHELAHLERGDPQWRLWQEALACALWPQPLLRLAMRQLEALAELDCDRRAVCSQASARALAQSLLTCAEHLRRPLPLPARRAAVLQPAMATTRSPLGERLQQLLDPQEHASMSTPDSRSPLKYRLLQCSATGLLLAASTLLLPVLAVSQSAAAPAVAGSPVAASSAVARVAPALAGAAVAAEPAVAAVATSRATASADAGSHSISVHQNTDGEHGEVRIAMGQRGAQLRAQFDGLPQFNVAGDALTGLKGGDTAWIEDARGNPRRRVDFERSGGELLMRYRVDGSEQPIDPAGRAWLADTLLTLVREAALDVEQRVAQLLAVGGPGRVMAEARLIHSGYARRRYLEQLVATAQLDDTHLDAFLFLGAQLRGDYDQRQILMALIKRQRLSASAQAKVLVIVAAIESDYEARQVLAEMADSLDLAAPSVRAAWARAIDSLGSGYERRQALEPLSERADLDEATLSALLNGIAAIRSDYEQRVSLERLAPRLAKSAALAQRYAQATASIDSDYEQRQALGALVEARPSDPAVWRSVLEASARLGSDYERRVLLTSVAAQLPDEPALVARYRQLASELGDYERSQAERALLRAGREEL